MHSLMPPELAKDKLRDCLKSPVFDWPINGHHVTITKVELFELRNRYEHYGSAAMDKTAVVVATEYLARAETALNAIDHAQTLTEMETAWSDFLTAANRVFSKLEQGAKINGKSKAWFGRKKHERRTDPILRYVHHARNADEHGLAKITEKTAAGLALGVGPGIWRFDGSIGPGGQMKITALGGQVAGESKFVETIPAKVNLVRVYDCGDPYDPPPGKLPDEVAKITLNYIRDMITEASQLP
jgi:hypothetical protein